MEEMRRARAEREAARAAKEAAEGTDQDGAAPEADEKKKTPARSGSGKNGARGGRTTTRRKPRRPAVAKTDST